MTFLLISGEYRICASRLAGLQQDEVDILQKDSDPAGNNHPMSHCV